MMSDNELKIEKYNKEIKFYKKYRYAAFYFIQSTVIQYAKFRRDRLNKYRFGFILESEHLVRI